MAASLEKSETGHRLGILREQLGYTQEQFAEKLDVSVSTVKKMETGEYNISVDTQRKLKKTFGDISIDYLLFGERKEANDLWTQIMVLGQWDKFIILQRLLALFGLNDKVLANKEIDEIQMRRFEQYLKDSFKD